jgi:hypothetical protein
MKKLGYTFLPVLTLLSCTALWAMDDDDELERVYSPLVKEENFDVNPDFQKIAPELLELEHLTYVWGKTMDLKTLRKLAGKWEEPQALEGKTGISSFLGTKIMDYDDHPGLVTYEAKLNFIAIVFRGSCKMGDWFANCNKSICGMDAKKHGFKFDGDYHEGFLEKYKNCKSSLVKKIDFFREKLNESHKKSLRFVIFGHSQGAALAKLASMDLATDYLKTTYGEEFDNIKENRLYGWFLSPPSIYPWLNSEEKPYLKWNNILGKNNMIWQSVNLDPVTGVRWGFGKVKYPGHIALESATSAMRKAGTILIEETRKKIKFGIVLDVLSNAYSIPAIVLRIVDWVGNKSNPPSFMVWVLGKIFEKSIGKYAEELGWNAIAPLHYGSCKYDPLGAFDPGMVGLGFNKNLLDGETYEKGESIPENIEEELKKDYQQETRTKENTNKKPIFDQVPDPIFDQEPDVEQRTSPLRNGTDGLAVGHFILNAPWMLFEEGTSPGKKALACVIVPLGLPLYVYYIPGRLIYNNKEKIAHFFKNAPSLMAEVPFAFQVTMVGWPVYLFTYREEIAQLITKNMTILSNEIEKGIEKVTPVIKKAGIACGTLYAIWLFYSLIMMFI